MNRYYLESLRSRSCYPTFRGFIQAFAWLGYLAAAAIALSGVFVGNVGPMLLLIAGAGVLALLVRAGTEMSLMLADLADAAIDQAVANPAVAGRASVPSEKIPRPAHEQRP